MNMQQTILAPDPAAIRAHLEAWATPFVGTEYDDGLVEIAYTAPGAPAPDRARLFGLDELDAAAAFAADQNARRANCYIGAALRAPDADPYRRSSALDFYAAAFAPCEADDDASGVAARIEALGAKGAIRVRTGSAPGLRVHHWIRLREICDDAEEFQTALGALVAHVGADAKVRDSARILRLGGTVNWITDARKAARGYVSELTLVRVEDAPAVDLERLTALEPMPGWAGPRSGGGGGTGGPGEITRSADGKVTDGREAFWRQIVMGELGKHQRETGADPTAAELFEAAFRRFCDGTEGDDRWTSPRGQAELRKRTGTTLRRLRSGHLARFGLFSVETRIGRAEAAQADRDRRRAAGPGGGAGAAPGEPQPLVREIPPGAPYPVAALGPLRPAVEAVQGATQAPVAIPAASALAVASLAVQGFANVETLGGPRPLSLYALTIARSGERKSACDAPLMAALREHERQEARNHVEAMESWRNAHALWKGERDRIIAEARKGKGEKRTAARADLEALGAEPAAPPSADRTVTEPTFEGLTRLFATGQPSLGIFSDEGGQFLGSHAMSNDNRQKTLAALNSLWMGDPIRRTRAGDGHVTLYGRRLAVHLMVQPTVARAFMADPLAEGMGFLPRCLICEPPSTIGTRLHAKARPDPAALAAFSARLRAVLETPLPADPETRELQPRPLPLAPKARALLVAFADAIEAAQAPGGDLAHVTGHASKAAEHAARIAGVLALWRDLSAPEVDLDAMEWAIGLAQYYLGEAARLADAAAVTAETDRAEKLRCWLLDTWPHAEITSAEVVNKGPNALREAVKAHATLGILEKHGWLAPLDPGTVVRGKPRKAAWRIIRGAPDVV